jgi:hypothetical protein
LVVARPERGLLLALDAAFDLEADRRAGVDAALEDPDGGSTATASISRSAPSRASPEIASVVLAGRF